MEEQDLHQIHERLHELIVEKGGEIKEIAYCPHKPEAGCECRKPTPGMILKLAEKYNIDLAKSIMVGDHERDIETGKKAGCITFIIGSGSTSADLQAESLYEAVEPILKLEI